MKQLLPILTTLFLTSTCFGQQADWGRVWKDNTGNHKTVAKLVEIHGNTITLKNRKGGQYKLPLSKKMKPDISEFSYGYAITEELIHVQSTPVVAAPVFPTQITLHSNTTTETTTNFTTA